MKLTRAQKEALGYLSRRECGLVHAATARVLFRNGLIARHGTCRWTDWWEITEAGRTALAGT